LTQCFRVSSTQWIWS